MFEIRVDTSSSGLNFASISAWPRRRYTDQMNALVNMTNRLQIRRQLRMLLKRERKWIKATLVLAFESIVSSSEPKQGNKGSGIYTKERMAHSDIAHAYYIHIYKMGRE
jgi:hypothetical protein